ncbi:unnamed protein product, partial [marine sediment metagenome]
ALRMDSTTIKFTYPNHTSSPTTALTLLDVSDNSAGNRFTITLDTSGDIQVTSVVSVGDPIDLTSTSNITAGSEVTVLVTLATDDAELFVNGSSEDTDADCDFLPGSTYVNIGSAYDESAQASAHISEVSIYANDTAPIAVTSPDMAVKFAGGDAGLSLLAEAYPVSVNGMTLVADYVGEDANATNWPARNTGTTLTTVGTCDAFDTATPWKEDAVDLGGNCHFTGLDTFDPGTNDWAIEFVYKGVSASNVDLLDCQDSGASDEVQF